jgi:chorismate mutase
MAGDWIKFELATPDKPEVWAIAASLSIDPDAVVGKLLRVWGWFDQQTENGNAPSVSKMLLDRLVGVSGFCKAVIDAGWMQDDSINLSLPHFDRHNGKTAKNRALTAKRVAGFKLKSNAEGNEKLTPDALPKEEKRREEKIVNTTTQKNKFSDDDKKCAEWLAGILKEFIPDCKTPNLNGWAEHVRKMREIDSRDHKEICQLWLWCRKDSFEAANVQSPEKLRSRYDSLKAKMNKAMGAAYGSHQQPNWQSGKQNGLAHDDTKWADELFGTESPTGDRFDKQGIQVIEGNFSSVGHVD